jgi:hypothetical protein
MKQSYLFLEWINNNFTLNVYDGISIVSLINRIKDDGSIKNMISEFSVHEVSRDVQRSSYGIEYDVRVDIVFKDSTLVRTKHTFLNSSYIEDYFVEYDEEFEDEGVKFNDLSSDEQWNLIDEWIENVIDCYWNS